MNCSKSKKVKRASYRCSYRTDVKEAEEQISSVDLKWFRLNLGQHLAGPTVQVFRESGSRHPVFL